MAETQEKAIRWTGDVGENQQRLLAAFGYERPAETLAESVVFWAQEEMPVIFRAEPGRFVSILYMEYCQSMDWDLPKIKKDASSFFGTMWHTDHVEFINTLKTAIRFRINFREGEI